MRITKDTLPDMRNVRAFMGTYTSYVTETLGEARLFPKFAPQRVVEAHGAWKEDLTRVSDHEPNLENGLDHFKQCGHLIFWVRRMSPLVEAIDLTENIADAPGLPLTDTETRFRNLLFGYANEYLAFDLGFQICKFYEINKPGSSAHAEGLVLSHDYYQTMCHFLKYKNVSPHAMYLILKSLFCGLS